MAPPAWCCSKSACIRARRRPGAIRVKGLSPGGAGTRRPSRRCRVRSQNPAHRQSALGAQYGQIGHAADVEHGDGLAGLAKHGLVEDGHQGRALSAGGNVAAAEISHHVNLCKFGQQCRVGQLQGVAAAIELLWLVPHRLSVGADGGDL